MVVMFASRSVHAKSSFDAGNQHHHVTDDGGNSCNTKNEPNTCITFDFKYESVTLTRYILRTKDLHSVTRWVIEGSNDRIAWKEHDRREAKSLDLSYNLHTYACHGGRRESFRYLRLCLIPQNDMAAGSIECPAIEFFGTLEENPESLAARKRTMEREKDRRRSGESDFIGGVDWFDGFGPFDGIISHLSKECSGNAHMKGVVNITASSSKHSQPHNIMDHG